MGRSGIKGFLKASLLGDGRRPRKIRGGPGRGLVMHMDPASRSQRMFGLDECELRPWLRRWLPGIVTCVDVGANDGYYTLIFLASGANRVLACEPGPAVDVLLENASLNGWRPDGRFEVVTRPIGFRDGEVRMDDLLRDGRGPILVKIDVDGCELDVLAGAEAVGRRRDTFWIVETHSEELEAGCARWFQERGWSPRVVRNAWWRAMLPERRHGDLNRWIVAGPERGRGPSEVTHGCR